MVKRQQTFLDMGFIRFLTTETTFKVSEGHQMPRG